MGRTRSIEATFAINTCDKMWTQQTFGIVAEWPDNWADMDESLFLEAFWIPTINQLRNEAKNRAAV